MPLLRLTQSSQERQSAEQAIRLALPLQSLQRAVQRHNWDALRLDRTERKTHFFTLVECSSGRALFLAEKSVSSEVIAGVLLGHVECNVVYTDEFRGYGCVSALGYEYLSRGTPEASMSLGARTLMGLRAGTGI